MSPDELSGMSSLLALMSPHSQRALTISCEPSPSHSNLTPISFDGRLHCAAGCLSPQSSTGRLTLSPCQRLPRSTVPVVDVQVVVVAEGQWMGTLLKPMTMKGSVERRQHCASSWTQPSLIGSEELLEYAPLPFATRSSRPAPSLLPFLAAASLRYISTVPRPMTRVSVPFAACVTVPRWLPPKDSNHPRAC